MSQHLPSSGVGLEDPRAAAPIDTHLLAPVVPSHGACAAARTGTEQKRRYAGAGGRRSGGGGARAGRSAGPGKTRNAQRMWRRRRCAQTSGGNSILGHHRVIKESCLNYRHHITSSVDYSCHGGSSQRRLPRLQAPCPSYLRTSSSLRCPALSTVHLPLAALILRARDMPPSLTLLGICPENMGARRGFPVAR